MSRHFDSSRLAAFAPILERAERAAADGAGPALVELRRYCLTDFCEFLMSLPDAKYPNLSRAMPKMPSADEQRIWTNSAGHDLLQDTIAFSRILHQQYEARGRSMAPEMRILDYGCGFGRLLRAMLYFVNPEELVGIDPWPRSIEICNAMNVLGSLALSEYVPTGLPVPGQFDLIYSYSVFTHLSPRSAHSSLKAIRGSIQPNGLFALTFRPMEYWAEWGPQRGLTKEQIDGLARDHEKNGFAFYPCDTEVDGELVYGTSSFSADWVESLDLGWRVRGYDRGADYWQQILILEPR